MYDSIPIDAKYIYSTDQIQKILALIILIKIYADIMYITTDIISI